MSFTCSDCTSRTLCQVCLDDFGHELEAISTPANIVLGEE